MVQKVINKKQRRQELFRFAVDLFITTLEQVTKRKVKYVCNNADTACWNVFMDTFSDSIGENFIKKFLLYGIQSWFNSGSEKDYSHSVRFNWIFGKSAIERWNKCSMQTNMHIVRTNLKKKYNISITNKQTNMPNIVSSLRNVEERYKADYHNSRKGLLWCIANTTLFHHKSPLCITCDYKKECRELLKQEYPKIYIKRGYAK